MLGAIAIVEHLTDVLRERREVTSLHGTGPIAAATSASATSVAVNVLVAGIAISPPARDR